ncbi:nickel pincer cofactor biosynthesis protein LarC [Commensalibacter oyaizuii]|uniref:LarC family nickel insertion protein n=1 Tax=Commensalibacter oyaizuii TaxID=3043873 RepID=A0ABT6Q4X2_9PROT|nr:LarC family nickel insertion protein [Commensalibacter sp. TBRC 16381]MDI2091544.1 LarC family nickel insertion protein [Commensalibacter sp. TBRC 16381]
MRIGYLDCFAGMSSSRFVGALVSAGVPEQLLHDAVSALDIGARLELLHIKRNNIATIKAHISLSADADTYHEAEETPYYELPTFISSHVVPDNIQLLSTIHALINNAQLSQRAKDLAVDTFTHLAHAEASVRGLPVEEIYFHKVRALNTVVGITLCCVGCDWLNIDQWYASSLNVGSGVLKYPQGMLPVPAPATLYLLGDKAPIFAAGPQRELLTSTCAGLLKALKVKFAPCPPMCISRVGYGAGRIEYDNLPNFLRICIGNDLGKDKYSTSSEIVITQAELGEVSAQRLQDVQQKLYEHGAQLVYIVPICSVISQVTRKLVIFSLPERAEIIRHYLFNILSLHSIHWRVERYERLIHYDEDVLTPWGLIKVQVGQLLDNQIISVIPDDERCAMVAQKHHLSYTEVVETVRTIFLSRKN